VESEAMEVMKRRWRRERMRRKERGERKKGNEE